MKPFFDSVRKSFGPLTQNQVDGLTILVLATNGLSLRHRAYVLATAWHETGPEDSPLHMTPRREIWGPTPAQSHYEGRVDLGNTVPGDGKRFMGRGYVQITGRTNYKRASDLTGRDLLANPDQAMEPKIAAAIIVDGMTKGWFTGKKMGDYETYRDMRRVVNGTDKADLIASYAFKFEDALKTLNEAEPSADPVQPDPVPEATSATAKLIAALTALGVAVAGLIAALANWNVPTN